MDRKWRKLKLCPGDLVDPMHAVDPWLWGYIPPYPIYVENLLYPPVQFAVQKYSKQKLDYHGLASKPSVESSDDRGDQVGPQVLCCADVPNSMQPPTSSSRIILDYNDLEKCTKRITEHGCLHPLCGATRQDLSECLFQVRCCIIWRQQKRPA